MFILVLLNAVIMILFVANFDLVVILGKIVGIFNKPLFVFE